MRCKQCGWDNPDDRERCLKCNNLLSRQRVVPSAGDMAVDAGPNVIDNSYPQSSEFTNDIYPQNFNNMQQQTYGNPGACPGNNSPITSNQPAADEERYCPECDALIPPGATECVICHTPVPVVQVTVTVVEGVCPECGTPVDENDRFCRICGTRLPEPEPVAEPEPEPEPIVEPEPVAKSAPEPEHIEDSCPACQADDDEVTLPAGPLAYDECPSCTLTMLAGNDGGREIMCTGKNNTVDLYRGNTDPANNTISREIQARLTYTDGKWCIEDCSSQHTSYLRLDRKVELCDGDVIVLGNRQFVFKS